LPISLYLPRGALACIAQYELYDPVSVTRQCSIETAEWTELVFDISAYPTLCNYKGIWMFPKTKVIPSGIVSQTLNLAYFYLSQINNKGLLSGHAA